MSDGSLLLAASFRADSDWWFEIPIRTSFRPRPRHDNWYGASFLLRARVPVGWYGFVNCRTSNSQRGDAGTFVVGLDKEIFQDLPVPDSLSKIAAPDGWNDKVWNVYEVDLAATTSSAAWQDLLSPIHEFVGSRRPEVRIAIGYSRGIDA